MIISAVVVGGSYSISNSDNFIDLNLGLLCSDYPGIAVCVEPESPEHLVDGIRQALRMPVPNPVAQDYACRFLDKEEILGRFEADLLELLQTR